MNRYRHFTDHEILDVLSQSSNALALYSTEDLIIQTANDAMIAIWDKDRSVIGQPLEEAVPELNGQPFIAMLKNVLKTGVTDSGKGIPVEIMTGGKLQVFYYDFEYRAIKNEAGETYCILHSATDVTTNVELYQAQQSLKLLNDELESRILERTIALAESEASVRYLIEDAPIAIAVFKGRDMVIETANQKVLEVWGKKSDIIGKPLHIGVPELQGQQFFNILENVYLTGEPYYGNEVKTLLEINNKVEEVYANFVYHPLKNEVGQVTQIMLIAHVVTDQVIARKKVEHAEEMLRFSVEAANAGTWYMDADTHEFKGSSRLKELFGFDLDAEVSYADVISRIPEEYRERVDSGVKLAFATGEKYYIEHPVVKPGDHKEHWVSASGKLYVNSTGKALHFSGLMLDITRQKQDEHRKNDFISMVSHELKTPLTSLSGYIQLLERNSKKAEDSFSSQMLQKAGNQLKKMTSLINGFLNISRLESGKIHLQKQHFELDTLIRDMIEDTRISASNFKFELIPCEPVLVWADRDKIGSVISNLLSNAVKYSPNKNLIVIKCILKGNNAEVSIKDEGLGIDHDDALKLFERFYRVDHKDNPNISGFGIGLYLSAEIIQHHGGKIWVDSEKGEGSTFYFNFPLSE